jgi:uncharacterized membrane protein YobD (UPF0266 family)
MQEGQQGANPNNEPGWVFKPGDSAAEPPAPAQPPAPSNAAPIQPVAQNSIIASEPMEPLAMDSVSVSTEEALVSWTASEYQANPKSAGWFGSLALASVLLAVVIYLVTRDLISTVVIGLVGVIVGIFAARQPQILQYHLDSQGIYIGNKFYPYASFKSFSVAEDQAMSYISLLSLRRFMPPLAIHYDPADEEKIVNTLADYLPYEEHKKDIVDNITRRFRL